MWASLYLNFTEFSNIKTLLKMKEWAIIGGLTNNFITNHLAFIYEVTTTFIIAAKEALLDLEYIPIPKSYIV